MKIESSGRNTRGSIRKISVPMLTGRATSKPCTWRMVGTVAVIDLLPRLYLLLKYLFDHLGVCFLPATKVIDRKRQLDASKLPACLIERIIGYGVEMKLDKGLLRLVAP